MARVVSEILDRISVIGVSDAGLMRLILVGMCGAQAETHDVVCSLRSRLKCPFVMLISTGFVARVQELLYYLVICMGFGCT